MNTSDSPSEQRATDNPFATSRIRPGALAFRFPEGATAESLVERLRQYRWRGQIVGRHGSGKSTLLAALIDPLKRAGRVPVVYRLGGGRDVPRFAHEGLSWHAWTQVIIDGYEQLTWFARRQLRRHCRRRRAGLLLTSHHRVWGVPVLFQTRTHAELACQLVDELLDGGTMLSQDDVRRAFALSRGDMRDMFFRLYDLIQERQGPSGDCNGGIESNTSTSTDDDEGRSEPSHAAERW